MSALFFLPIFVRQRRSMCMSGGEGGYHIFFFVFPWWTKAIEQLQDRIKLWDALVLFLAFLFHSGTVHVNRTLPRWQKEICRTVANSYPICTCKRLICPGLWLCKDIIGLGNRVFSFDANIMVRGTDELVFQLEWRPGPFIAFKYLFTIFDVTWEKTQTKTEQAK